MQKHGYGYGCMSLSMILSQNMFMLVVKSEGYRDTLKHLHDY